MNELIDDKLWLCSDCSILTSNDDASGMSEGREQDCRESMAALGGYLAANNTEEEGRIEFSSRQCSCCKTHLAGARERYALFAFTATSERSATKMSDTPKFNKSFDSFVCDGDSISIDLPNGDTITARIERDFDAGSPEENQDGFWPSKNPEDAGYCPDFDKASRQATECFSAWTKGEWWYVGIVLSHEMSDVFKNDHVSSLWGIEANCTAYQEPGSTENPNAYLTEVANNLLAEYLRELQEATIPLEHVEANVEEFESSKL